MNPADEIIGKINKQKFYNEYFEGIKDGENSVKCCFHEDNSPSLSIDASKTGRGNFYCHSCGEKGDLISFYQKKHSTSFKKTLMDLKNKFNLRVSLKEKKEGGPKPLRAVEIDLENHDIVEYFKSKNIKNPSKVIKAFNLKYCQNNEAIVIPVGERYKLKYLDGSRDAWDIDSNKAISPVYSELNPLTGQKNIIYLEGFSNLWALADVATDEFKDNYYVVTSVHGVNSTKGLHEKFILEGKRFENTYSILDNDEAGEKASAALKKLDPSVIEVKFKEEELRDTLANIPFEDFYKTVRETRSIQHEVYAGLLEIVKSRNIFKILIRDCHKLGIVGEETNIVLILLALATYKNETPISQVIKGETDSGKTFVFNTLLDLIPQENIIKVASFSAQALAHIGDISNHVIVETEGNSTQDDNYRSAVMYLRQLITEKEVSRMISEIDPMGKGDKKIISRLKKTKGPIQYNVLTTQERLNDENENRLVCLNICNDPEHREKIQRRNSAKWKGERISSIDRQIIVEKWRQYIDMLPAIKDSDIVIPFADHIKVTNYQGSNRDQDRMCLLTGLVHWFHMVNEEDLSAHCAQLGAISSKTPKSDSSEASNARIPSTQKEKGGRQEKKHKKVIATLEDYKVLYDLVIDFYNSRSTDVTQAQLAMYHKLRNIKQGTKFISKEVAGIIKKSTRSAQNIIKGLVDIGMVDKLDEKDGKFDVYKVNQEWEFRGCGLATPKDIADKLHYTFIDENSSNKEIVCKNTSQPPESFCAEGIQQAAAVIPKDSDSFSEISSNSAQCVEDDEEIDEDDMFNFD